MSIVKNVDLYSLSVAGIPASKGREISWQFLWAPALHSSLLWSYRSVYTIPLISLILSLYIFLVLDCNYLFGETHLWCEVLCFFSVLLSFLTYFFPSFLFFFLFERYLDIYLFSIYVCMCQQQCPFGVRRELTIVSFLLLSCVFWRLNSGLGGKCLYPYVLPHCPLNVLFYLITSECKLSTWRKLLTLILVIWPGAVSESQ